MGLAVPIAPSATSAGDGRIRVMVVDDAAVVRGLLCRWVEEEPDFVLAASLRTGREAVDQVERANPDVVILDIEMPVLDGISALPLLLAKKRDLVVIMASTLTRHNAEISLKALSLGAADYIPKPETSRGVTNSATFRRELIEKIRHLGARKKQRERVSLIARNRASNDAFARAPTAHQMNVRAGSQGVETIKLRPFSQTAPRALVIGSSTGGPQALIAILSRLQKVVEQAPVLVAQHMPPTFTTILAEHIARVAGKPAREAVDGEPATAGTIYVAPGGRHMRVARRDSAPIIRLDDGPPINFCKPAVDPLFSSAAAVWGPAVLALILTGMGSDGWRGGQEIVASGGSVIAQDETTSVVWGMPGAAAHAGICSAILPLDQIAAKVMRLFSGERV